MEITDIRVRRVDSQGKLKAYVTVTFDHCFVVHNVKVIEGGDRVFIAMPSRKTRTGEFKDVAHPITSEFRNTLQEQIVSAYEADTGPVHSFPDAHGEHDEGEERVAD
ncbi:MAG: septation regulator SpoVG [Spirochaetota bacterium]